MKAHFEVLEGLFSLSFALKSAGKNKKNLASTTFEGRAAKP